MQQGHMGAGILAGLAVFVGLSAIFSLYAPVCYVAGACAPASSIFRSAGTSIGALGVFGDGNVLSMLTGSSVIAFMPIFESASGGIALSPVATLLAVIAPVVAGLFAGLLSRGGAGNGFVAGFSGVLVGYYLMFIFLFLYLLANGMQLGSISSQGVTPLVGVVIIIPIISGILGGAGGAITAAVFGFPPVSTPHPRAESTVTTTIMQVTSASPPELAQDLGKASARAKPPTCPACGAGTDPSLTFCQACGERLK